MNTFTVVIGLVYYNNQVLLLKRNPERKHGANKWEFVSGHHRVREPLEEAITREVKEETGLNCEIIKRAQAIETIDDDTVWILIPFLLQPTNSFVEIDFEHTDYAWVKPDEVKNYDHVSGVFKVMDAFDIKY